jgi:ubiquinone/menaquinone biosynthesis C-methylase UbiE
MYMPMTSTSTKAYKGIGMEGAIARWYATLTSKGMKDFEALAQRVAPRLSPGSSVLEVAPGPGFFCIELAKLGPFHITGLDISKTFVQLARKNAAEAQMDVRFLQGNAAAMPFEDDCFNFLLCRAAFKNFAEPVCALQEMCRVLKPGGGALIIDLRKDAPRAAINQAVEEMNLNSASRIMTKLAFRVSLLKRAYTKSDFQQFLGQTNFGHVDIQESLTGFEIFLSK